ncbi:MAG: hypothetical protein V1905_00985 [bacterium]
MTKQKRTILFIICLSLFIILAPVIILYSAGYRLDIKERRITQAGGFYFRVQPKNASISIQGKPKKQTDLLFGTALIENLTPKSYQVSVNKNGHIAWTKSLIIEPRKVTEAKNITLVPKNIISSELDGNSARLFRSPKGNRIILEKYRDGFEYFAFISSSNREEIISSADLFGEEQIYIHKFIFSDNEQLALTKVSIANNINSQRYYLLDYRPDNRLAIIPAVKLIINIPNDAKNIRFSPDGSQQLLFIANDFLWKTVSNGKSIELRKNIKAFTFSGNDLYYLDSRGFTYKSDSNVSYSDRINDSPFLLKEDNVHEIGIYGNLLTIKDGESFSRFNQNTRQFEKIFNQTSEIRLSPDNKKLAIISGSEIWLLYLYDSPDAPYKKAGELVFLTRLSDQAKSIYWYTSHYLIFTAKDIVKIIEIDDRDVVNVAEPTFYTNIDNGLISQKNIDIVFNERVQRLYLLSDNVLYLSGKIVN